MSYEETLRATLHHLLSLKEHQAFYDSYSAKKEILTLEDMDVFLDVFKAHLSDEGIWDDEFEIKFKINWEQTNILQHQKSENKIFSINESIKLNDNWLNEFQKEFNQCLTGDKFPEEIKPRRYNTNTEYLILLGIDGNKLSKLYSKYSEFNHPYVNYQVASILYNSKNFSSGLPILSDGIKSIASFPNYYWNNEDGIEGATWMLADLLFLLGNNLETIDFRNEKIKLLKLLFLYMSRYIYMTDSNIKSIDFYSNRARVVKDNYTEFIGIFGIGVNPDIQYISDMYLAYQVSSKNNLTSIPSFMQFMWDSLKMYEHGSHIPNGSGGYKEIEDRTWIELVSDGEIRSVHLAEKLLKEFENYELNISNSTIDKIFNHLSETKMDDLGNYI